MNHKKIFRLGLGRWLILLVVYTLIIFKPLSVNAVDNVLILGNSSLKKWFSSRIEMFKQEITYNLGANAKLNIMPTVCVLKENSAVGLYCPVVDLEENISGYCMTEINTQNGVKNTHLLDWMSGNSKRKIEFTPRILNVIISFDKKVAQFIFDNNFSYYSGLKDFSDYCCVVEKTTIPGFYSVHNMEIHRIEKKSGKSTVLRSIDLF